MNFTCKTMFLSDLHLGSTKCNANAILKVLHEHQPENLYLVGDIIDFWALKRKFYFPDSHWRVIQKIIRLSHKGTNVVYITGNHDDLLRYKLFPIRDIISPIHFCEEIEWISLCGKKFLVLHGDKFDRIITNHKWVAVLGDVGYTFLLKLNRYYPFRGSLARIAKNQTKKYFCDKFENTLVKYSQDKGYGGVICGHIHNPKQNTGYINCGDFVDSCSYVLEDYNGKISIQFER